MMKFLSLSAVFAFLAFFSLGSHAATIGPVYPAEGGNVWVGNGVSAADGVAIWNYSNFDVSGVTGLYFGLDQVSIYGPAGAGLSGSPDAFVFDGASGQTATWTALTIWDDPNSGGGVAPATTRLEMTITGLGANPWITNLASVGLDDTGTFGALGAVADNSAGADFVLTWTIMADTGSGYIPINDVQQPAGPPYDQTRSSVATGFYHTSAVPLPAAAWLFISALGGLVVAKRKQLKA